MKSIIACLMMIAMWGRADLSDFASPGASLSLADLKFIVSSNNLVVGSNLILAKPAGDIDGDGLDDILMGDPYHDHYSKGTRYDDVGKAYLFLGKTISRLLRAGTAEVNFEEADLIFYGEDENDYSSWSFDCGRDVDGDAIPDIAIGAFNHDLERGIVYFISGKTVRGTLRYSLSTKKSLATSDLTITGRITAQCGKNVAMVGDIDKDQLAEILLSSDNSASSSEDGHLFLGSHIASLLAAGTTSECYTNADLKIIATNNFSGSFGVCAGDIDGDGRDDVLLGDASGYDPVRDAGRVSIFLGETLSDAIDAGTTSISVEDADFNIFGEDVEEYCGVDLRGMGDLDGDGFDDIAVSAVGNDEGGSGAGKTAIFLGSSIMANVDAGTSEVSLSDADWSFLGKTSDLSGCSISSTDMDGDGENDLMVGAYGNDDAYTSAGITYVVASSTLLDDLADGVTESDYSSADYALTGEAAGDLSGSNVSAAGDVNGDGAEDFLVVAPFSDHGSSTYLYGDVYLILGTCSDPTDAVYVDINDGSESGTGSQGCPLLTISDGIDLAQSLSITNVIVRGGYYYETVHMAYGINLIGEKKEVDGTNMIPIIVNTNMSDYAVYGAGAATMKFFGVLDGGIILNGVTYMTLQENWVLNRTSEYACVMIDAQSMNNTVRNNLLINWVKTKDVSALKIGDYASNNSVINNAMHRRGVPGARISTATVVYMTEYAGALGNNLFYNNILFAGTTSAVTTVNKRGFYAESSSVGCTIRYNYSLPTNINVTVSLTTNLKGYTPGFMDTYSSGFDYSLDTKLPSPCIDVGTPTAWPDADGTRNDMGCYGGSYGFDQEE